MRPRTLIAATTLLLTVTACGSTDPEDEGSDAGPSSGSTVSAERSTELTDPEGSVLGRAWLRDAADGTELELDVTGLPAGLQDVGLYESEGCEAVAPDAPVIDVPPVTVLEDGTASLTTTVDPTSLEDLLEGDGVAVVLTDARVEAPAGPDAGLPGSYLACGAFSG